MREPETYQWEDEGIDHSPAESVAGKYRRPRSAVWNRVMYDITGDIHYLFGELETIDQKKADRVGDYLDPRVLSDDIVFVGSDGGMSPQEAHDSLPSDGGSIFVVGSVSDGLTITKPVSIYGFSPTIIDIEPNKTWDLDGGVLSIQSKGVRINGIHFEAGGIALDGNELDGEALVNIELENVVVRNSPDVGVEISHPLYNSVLDVTVRGADGWGWDISSDWCNENTFRRFAAHSCSNGIRIGGGSFNGNMISMLYSEKNDGYGLYVDCDTFRGNQIFGYGSEDCSLYIQPSDGSTNFLATWRAGYPDVSVDLQVFSRFDTRRYRYDQGLGSVATDLIPLDSQIEFAHENGSDRFYIPNGAYEGRIDLHDGMEIVGESRDGVVLTVDNDIGIAAFGVTNATVKNLSVESTHSEAIYADSASTGITADDVQVLGAADSGIEFSGEKCRIIECYAEPCGDYELRLGGVDSVAIGNIVDGEIYIVEGTSEEAANVGDIVNP